MKLLYDFFPIILFFVAFKLGGIYTATLVAIVASVVQLGIYWLKHKRFEKMHVISAVLIITLGGLTIALQDKAFIMWKPTLVNWLFALVFAGSLLIGGKPLIERMLGGKIQMPSAIWLKLNWAWVGFFLLSGVANLYFALDYLDSETALRTAVPTITDADLETFKCEAEPYQPNHTELCQTTADKEELWVNFKLFGLLGLMVIFIIGQAIYMSRHMKEETSGEESDISQTTTNPNENQD